MHITTLTFDGFNELAPLIAFGMLSRISLLGDKDWRVSIASPMPRVTSMNVKSTEAAREVLHNFAPVGEKDEYVARGMAHIEAFI
jgi:hypothetical protein